MADQPARFLTWHTCPTCDGKRAYPDRKTARRAARRTPGRHRARVHAYRCAAGWWHVGHVPTVIRTGTTSRKDYLR